MTKGPAGLCAALLAASLLSLAPPAPPRAARSADDLVRLNNLGIAYLAQYKPAEAEKQFRQAVALDPNYLPGHVNIGISALAQVHYDDAVEAFTRALALDPDSIHARFNLSLILKLQGKATEALAEANRALQLDSRDADIHYHVGSLYMTSREYDKAIAEFDAVLKIDPNFLSAYYSLGRAWMVKGEVEKGKKFIEKHRELQAGASATPAVGLRYGEQGKYSFAMEDTGGSGPTPRLEKGGVTFSDVSSTAGIEFVHGGAGGLDLLRKPAPGASLSGPAVLRSTVGPILGSGLAVADVDGDGREDLLLLDAGAGGKSASALYMNRGGMQFARMSGPGAPAVSGPAISAAFGDLDGDGDPDLVVGLEDRVQIFVNLGSGKFSEAAGAAGPVSAGLLGGVSLADVDHDGDLDIFAAGFLSPLPGSAPNPPRFPLDWPGGTSLLFLNGTAQKDPGEAVAAPAGAPATPAMKLAESAARALVSRAGHRTSGAIFSDFDNDRDIDIALASPGDGTTVLSNMRDGTFKDLGAASGLPANALVLGLAAGDYNKDGWMDLVATTWDGGLPRLFRNMMGDPAAGAGRGGGAFALDATSLADVPRQAPTPMFGVAFADFDNDGYLDILSVNGGDAGPALLVLRNDGAGSFIDAGDVTGADQIAARGGRGLAAADLDADGDLDFVISNSGGRPTIIRNDGGNKNHWVSVAPRGLHSNKPAAGTKVEIKAGALWQKTEVAIGSGYLSQSSIIAHFGLGARTRVDTVRLLWPGGVLQDEVQAKADGVFAVEELDRKGSSCPILYAWNGHEIGFVSDFLGGSAIGYRTGPDSFEYPDTDEYVRVTGEQLRPKEGLLMLRMVNQLEETIYFDRARLVAVDHPAGYEIYPDERLMPAPPFPAFRLFAVKDARAPAAAVDEQGNDRLEAVSRADRVYAGPSSLLPFKGYAREHTLTLDLGPIQDGAPVLLLLYGWIDYADSTSNVAAAQAGATLRPPWIDALDGNGGWVRVLPQMGFPAGLPKTMTVDLTGMLPPGCHVVRLGTSMRIYWDRIQVATDLGPAPSLTGLEAARADLRYRGFPAMASPDGRPPETYDYLRDQERVHWKTHVGAFTRYGDVRALLASVDDRYAITRPGDEIALEFPASGLPPLPDGYVRDYLLYADGFGKDMDLNSARPDTVTPLPWHAMKGYPPQAGDGYPLSAPGVFEYLDTYNTRLVVAPLIPIKSP
ncbi:MAG TPA: FG-GAP-like repeat-containing protein [Candidatus Polarisedimenticolia bacterium]|jgi:Flp pilus assembly protein TadD